LGNQESAITAGLGKAKGAETVSLLGHGRQGTVLQDQMYLANLSSSVGPEKKSTKIREAARAIFLPFFSPSLTEWRTRKNSEKRNRRRQILREKMNEWMNIKRAN
jgi:hypothetical protein